MSVRAVGSLLIVSSLALGRASAQNNVAVGTSTTDPRAAAAALERVTTVHLTQVSLRQAIDAVAAKAGVRVLYKDEIFLEYTAPVSIHVTAMPVKTVFLRIFKDTRLHIVPLAGGAVSIQDGDDDHTATYNGVIAGLVLNAATKQPIKGATVSLDGAAKGVFTDDEGRFRFASVPVGTHTLTAKFIGSGRQTQAVTVDNDATVTLTLTLAPGVSQLDQVVVTGTVIPTELKAVPNAITVITAKELQQRGITRVDQLFRGDVAGVFSQNNGSGSPVEQVTLFSRGNTQMIGQDQGLKTYVDGVELADPKYLSQIDPTSIERIEILTGPQASTIYGSGAINGVMQIFTKRGTTQRPQLVATIQSGWVENDFSSALTPQHTDAAQVSGTDAHVSYHVGGSWDHVGRWTPSVQLTRTSGFGGARVTQGPVTADATFRLASTVNRARGLSQASVGRFFTDGYYTTVPRFGVESRFSSTLNGLTLGMTLTYAPTTWWLHELGLGSDASNLEQVLLDRRYFTPFDSLPNFSQTQEHRRSVRYTTTTRIPLSTQAQATLTAGADGWNNGTTTLSASTATLTGTFTNNPDYTRAQGHNRGLFTQGQVGVRDALFLTYGLRAEWNPNFGVNAEPNLAPRYGAVYTRALNGVTAKLRASYGRSTRPPVPGQKVGRSALNDHYSAQAIALYGNFYSILPNTALSPEFQKGGEGGMDLYFGTRGSFSLTRYDQTVEGLILNVNQADSARSLQPLDPNETQFDAKDVQGYGYEYQSEYLNVGSIRNQGWELQGVVNTGPLTTKGTYSWTKSRFLKVAPLAQATAAVIGEYPGAVFAFLPEHTWAVTTTYAQGPTMVSLTVNGIGAMQNLNFGRLGPAASSNARLQTNQLRTVFASNYSANYPDPAYATADLNASRRFTSALQGMITVKNLSDYYRDDQGNGSAVLGRQMLFGLRVIW